MMVAAFLFLSTDTGTLDNLDDELEAFRNKMKVGNMLFSVKKNSNK
jgi:hypothetical protein